MYKFALIGCGRIAPRHAENIAAKGTLAAVCDIDKARADVFAAQYNAIAYYSIHDLLAGETEFDVLSVCTPNGLHAEHSIKALQAGKHVVCEKPLCILPVAAFSMMDTAHFFRRRLFIVKQNRYNEPVVFVKKLLSEQRLGTILSFQINCFWNRPQQYYTGDWRGSNELDGGLLYTQFSHFIDLLYWFLGDVQAVAGMKANHGRIDHLHTEDGGTACIQMSSGAIGTINYTVNSFEKNMEGSFTIFGEKGTIKIGGQYLNTIEYFNAEEATLPPELTMPQPNDYGFYTGSMSNHHRVYEDVINALDHKQTNLPEIVEAVKTIEIIHKIYAQSMVV